MGSAGVPENPLIFLGFLVPVERIELSTYPLPRVVAQVFKYRSAWQIMQIGNMPRRHVSWRRWRWHCVHFFVLRANSHLRKFYLTFRCAKDRAELVLHLHVDTRD
jgi:hypothetical protein